MVFSYDEITVPNCDRGIQVVRTSFMSWNSSRLMSGGIVGCGLAVVGINSTLDTWRLRKPSPATINPQILYIWQFCDDLIFAFFAISYKLQNIEYAEIIFCIIFYKTLLKSQKNN